MRRKKIWLEVEVEVEVEERGEQRKSGSSEWAVSVRRRKSRKSAGDGGG
jgi:hypothetical protein